MEDQMVFFSPPSISFAVAPISPRDGLHSASAPTYSSESLTSPPISDISDLEDWNSMSVDDQLNSLSKLGLQELKTVTHMKHPDYYITGGDVVFLVCRYPQACHILSHHLSPCLFRATDVG